MYICTYGKQQLDQELDLSDRCKTPTCPGIGSLCIMPRQACEEHHYWALKTNIPIHHRRQDGCSYAQYPSLAQEFIYDSDAQDLCRAGSTSFYGKISNRIMFAATLGHGQSDPQGSIRILVTLQPVRRSALSSLLFSIPCTTVADEGSAFRDTGYDLRNDDDV